MKTKTELFIRKFIDDNELTTIKDYVINQNIINQNLIVLEIQDIIYRKTQNISIDLLDYITSVILNYTDKR